MARIVGTPGRPAQQQATRADGWNKQRRLDFLTTLARTSNVAAASRAADMSTTGAYALRRRDLAFAALWADALEEGYQYLEGELLAHVRGVAVDEDNPGLDELAAAERPEHRIDPVLALKMLQLRDARVKNGMNPQVRFMRRSQEEIDAALIKLCRGLAKADLALLSAPGSTVPDSTVPGATELGATGVIDGDAAWDASSADPTPESAVMDETA